jgi:hypothetical protein
MEKMDRILLVQVRIVSDRFFHLFNRSQDHGYAVSGEFQNFGANQVGQFCGESLVRTENHVPTLDVAPYAIASGIGKHLFERFHRKHILAANIYSSKKSDVRVWHNSLN